MAAVSLAIGLALSGCGSGESDLPPDGRLQRELGLEPSDRVHEVRLHGGVQGSVEPAEAVVLQGDYLQFVTADAWVHELLFEADSLSGPALAFMEGLDQLAGPPMVSRGSRFVLSFVDAPPGRYPFRVEGGGPARTGVIVVEPLPAR
jgi:hypothetical protein